MVKMTDVDSSNVCAVGYDGAKKELSVCFKGSPTMYVYEEVPEQIYADMMVAASKGAFVRAHIANQFKFRKETS